jgi:alcohol dehydrogenase
MLPHIIRFNAEEPASAETYRELAITAGLTPNAAPTEAAVSALVSQVRKLVEAAREATATEFPRLSNGLLPTLAAEANQQWTARFNPREITAPDFEKLYAAALS